MDLVPVCTFFPPVRPELWIEDLYLRVGILVRSSRRAGFNNDQRQLLHSVWKQFRSNNTEAKATLAVVVFNLLLPVLQSDESVHFRSGRRIEDLT